MAPPPRIRPYKDFLTPTLHRRFALATATLLVLCYLESVWIGGFDSLFWSWFPFGRAGIRTGLLFIPAFMIFILRVAQLHVGIRTSLSPWDTFRQYAIKYQVVQTIIWYSISALIFSEVYIWSASKEDDLSRVKTIPRTDRKTLNEKPIYVTSYFIFLAFIQAGFHLYFDYDRIDMPVVKTKPNGSTDTASVVTPPAVQVKAKLLPLAQNSIQRAVVAAATFPVIYSLKFGFYPYSIRSFGWTLTRSWAKIFYTLPKSSSLPSIGPYHWQILIKTGTSGFLLFMLWEVGNAAFSAYVAQEPLKNERPITYESRDPNGSLLTGLRGKKLQTRAFAFWELLYIAERFEGRRKAIFEDIDRKGGSTWSQILQLCLEVINGVTLRVSDYERPATVKSGSTPKEDIPGLPRLGQPPISDKNVFSDPPAPTRKEFAAQAVANFAKEHGQSPGGAVSPKRLLKAAEDAVLTPAQKEALARQGFVGGLFREWALWFLKSPVGWPFRQEYRRKIGAIVLGSPYGDVGIIVDAIDALTRLAVCSLNEDKYGNVQRDVKLIIRTFTDTVTVLEAFRTRLGVHWTDIEQKQETPEVDAIVHALKAGLNSLVGAFGDYREDLGLSQSDMRLAREAAAAPTPEMQQRR